MKNKFKFIRFENGLTIKELKEIIKNLPEKNNLDEPFEIWIENTKNSMSSRQVTEIRPLNQSENGCDLFLI